MDQESSHSRQLRDLGIHEKSPSEIARIKREAPWLFKDYVNVGSGQTRQDVGQHVNTSVSPVTSSEHDPLEDSNDELQIEWDTH